MLTLKQFLYSVPICTPPITYQQLRHLFQSTQQGHDSVVVVNREGIPFGIIFSHDFLKALLNEPVPATVETTRKKSRWEQSPSVGFLDWDTCISPLTLIPCHLRVSDLAYLLQANRELAKQSSYGLVDEQGKFLGLLNSWQILQTVLGEQSHSQQEFLSVKNLIKELLEELPLPVMLQTHQGEIIQQNRTWREQIGEFIPPDNATACPLPHQTTDHSQTVSIGDRSRQDHKTASMTDIACPQ